METPQAAMMVRFDVEAYRINPWMAQNPKGIAYSDAQYAENKRAWRSHAEAFMSAARQRGARVFMDVFIEHQWDEEEEQAEQYSCTAYMTAGQFGRMLMDIAHTPLGTLIRTQGTMIAASIAEGSEGRFDAQELITDPIVRYLGHVYIDSEYDGEGPRGWVPEWYPAS